jgi:hypothetical protein
VRAQQKRAESAKLRGIGGGSPADREGVVSHLPIFADQLA